MTVGPVFLKPIPYLTQFERIPGFWRFSKRLGWSDDPVKFFYSRNIAVVNKGQSIPHFSFPVPYPTWHEICKIISWESEQFGDPNVYINERGNLEDASKV
jgi:hypothetical protein